MRASATTRLVVVAMVSAGCGALGAAWLHPERAPAAAHPIVAAAPATETTTAPTATTVTTAAPDPLDATEALARAGALAAAGVVAPTDCLFDPDHAEGLPGAPRPYRAGTHQGVDFYCGEADHPARAALGGRVAVASTGHTEANAADRQALLDVAAEVGRTPALLLPALWGRHVVLDHGVVPGVGHVATVYAHLDTIDPAVRTGVEVAAGQPLGRVGLSGISAASPRDEPGFVHLHWEVHVDDAYLGRGLDPEATEAVYRALLGR